MDRFDLEQAIMNSWTTKDDVDILCENILDGKLSNDEIANALIGISQLHNMRCSKVFDIFEDLIENRKL